MGRFLLAAIATASIAATAMPALAQDESFTGGHVTALAGWDNFSAGSRQSTSKDDVVWGFSAGYDFQTGGVVIGAEGEITWTSVDTDAFAVLGPADLLRIEAGRDIYVGARIGIPFSPRFLGYVKGGYSNLLVETTYYPANPGGIVEFRSSDTDGYRFGAGAQYRFSTNIYVTGEYRYSHYGAIGEHNPDFDIDTDRNQIVLGVGFKF